MSVHKLRLSDVRYNAHAIEYAMSDADIETLLRLAVARQEPKNGSAVARDKRTSKIGNVEAHFMGLKGEWACSRFLETPLDAKSYLSGNVSFDFKWRGLTIETKTRRGFLVLNGEHEFLSEVLILATVDNRLPDKVFLQGWTNLSEFRKMRFLNDFGYGPKMCMQPADMYAMKWLARYTEYVKNKRAARLPHVQVALELGE